MVLSPLHYVHAYFVHRFSRGRISLPGLVVGCMITDLENPILLLMGFHLPFDRLVLHSFIGAALFSWLVGLLLLPLYRLFVEYVLNVNFTLRWGMVNYAFAILISAEIHVLVDSFHHPYNPLLWPLTNENFSYLVLFNDWLLASIFLQLVFACLMTIIVLSKLKRIGFSGGLTTLKRLLASLLVSGDC